MNINDYDKLLLDELRFVTYEKGDSQLTEELLVKAVTLNENLSSLGYSLSPNDIASLAVSPSLDGFFERVRSMTDEVKAEPMYPGFPKQVMEIDAAVFRFHQLVHYFSTYGMELLFGVEAKHGWLPYENTGSKIPPKEQENILAAKTLKLLPSEDEYLIPLRMILSRRERMTLPEMEIVSKAISGVSPSELAGIGVGFKENLNTLYSIVFEMDDRDSAFEILRVLCQHTGDVLRCVDILLGANRYHFRTSQKRFLVKLLESYPEKDFRSNLVLSGRGAERNIRLLNYLDYSVYSRSAEHMAAVNQLRDGKLRSWESIAKSMLSTGDEGTLDFISGRPGIMLRMVAWLLRLGYTSEDILEKLSPKASALSIQTLVTNMNHFGKLTPEERADAPLLFSIFESLLKDRLLTAETPLRGKKVMLRMDEYNLALSELRCNNKSAEGGYIRSGIAYRIPENVHALRFFVYWNDSQRVDVDLHTGFTDLEGTKHSVGWNSRFRETGVVFSGDITHSNAAEYIDIDLSAPIDRVFANIHLYSGRPSFSTVKTCFVGMMAVPFGNNDGRYHALYSASNCFFKHNLRQDCESVYYGYIDVPNRCLIFDGSPDSWNCNWYGSKYLHQVALSMEHYLELLFEAQGVSLCDNAEEADLILVMGKPENEKEISFVDSNFFMD